MPMEICPKVLEKNRTCIRIKKSVLAFSLPDCQLEVERALLKSPSKHH